MCIAYFLSTFPVLSETFISREILNLTRLGLEIEIIAFSRPDPSTLSKSTAEIRSLADQTHYISNISAMGHCASSLSHPAMIWFNHELQQSATRKSPSLLRLGRAYVAVQLVKRLNITHIHAHWPYPSMIAAMAHLMTGIPYSVSIHAHEVTQENGHFPLIFENLSFAVFCNQAQMRLIETQYHEKLRLVYHGVNLDTFPPSPIPSSSPLRILSVGRLCQDKRFDRLIRGCAKAVEAGLDVELTILGTGSLEQELRLLADNLGFSRRLKMPGWVSHDEVKTYFSQAHVFALLSAGYGLPNVVLEAMACGRPVILSAIPEAAEAVTDRVEGFIIHDPDDPDCLIEILRTPADQLAKLGEAAHARVARDFDEQKYIHQLAALFPRQETS